MTQHTGQTPANPQEQPAQPHLAKRSQETASPASSARQRPGPTAARQPQRLLALQSSLGNRAVQRMLSPQPPIQRHPDHAEEQEVQTQRDPALLAGAALQRHPDHAEEQEVQTQRDPALAGRARIQRLAVGKDDKDQPVQVTVSAAIKKLTGEYHFKSTKALKASVEKLHKDGKAFDDWDALDAALRKEGHPFGRHEDKRLRLEATFGIPIGGESGAQQFGDKMLDTLDQMLRLVPMSHISTLNGIERKKSDEASFYEPERRVLTISYAQPAALYTWASKNTKIFNQDARQKMEEAALGGMLEGTGYNKKDDAGMGLDSTKRSVISYARSDAFAGTRIVEWTVLHELGHAVDEQIKWTERNGGKAEFGGWKTHGERDDAAAKAEVATPYLAEQGLTLEMLDALHINYADIRSKQKLKGMLAKANKDTAAIDKEIEDLRAGVGAGKTGRVGFFEMMTEANNPEAGATRLSGWAADPSTAGPLKAKLRAVFEKIRYAIAAPWQFPDGLAAKLAVGGRVYQLDHYKSWVSYLAEARKTPLSPYQFSSPGEWIAEAYAAFYGTNASARALLSSATKAKIQEELGAPPAKETKESDREKGSFEKASGGGKDGSRASLMTPEQLEASKAPQSPLQGMQVVEEADPSPDPEEPIVGSPSEAPSPLMAALSNEDPFSA